MSGALPGRGEGRARFPPEAGAALPVSLSRCGSPEHLINESKNARTIAGSGPREDKNVPISQPLTYVY